MRLLNNKKRRINWLLGGVIIAAITACGSGGETVENDTTDKNVPATTTSNSADPAKSIGVGPIKNVELGEIDQNMVAEGLVIFESKCTACHKIEERYIGPPVKGITERRTPEWIMNMILNPEVMVKEDPQAKALLAEYLAPMANQNLTEDEARKVLEYFRTLK